MNPALTESLPPYQTACGVTDIISHAFERYFTVTPNVETTDRMLEGVVLAMLHEGVRVMENPHDYDARANIMWAGMVCHNDIMGVGRAQDWNSHHLEHVLSAVYDIAHGAGLADIMPAWMEYCIEHTDGTRFVQMATRIFGCQMDFDDPKDIPRLVEMNNIGDGVTGGYVGLDKQAHFDIYEIAAGIK